MKKLILICSIVVLAGMAESKGTRMRGAPVLPDDGVRLIDLQLAVEESIDQMGLDISLADDRPGYATVSITTDIGDTTWYTNLLEVAAIPSRSTVLVWDRQDIDGRLLLPTTTNSTIRGVGVDRMMILIDWDGSDIENNNIAAFNLGGVSNTLERLDIINLYDNTNAVAYAYTVYCHNDMVINDCGIYMAGRYRHHTELWGYKALVIVGNSGQSKVYNSTIGALSTDETGLYVYAHAAAIHDAVPGSLLQNVTFVNSRMGTIDGDLDGNITIRNCRANVPIPGTTLIGEDSARAALTPSLHYYLPTVQDVVNTKLDTLNFADIGAMKEVTNSFHVTQSAGGEQFSLDADAATLQDVSAVLATLIKSLGLTETALYFGADGHALFPSSICDIQPVTSFKLSFDAKVSTFLSDGYFFNNQRADGSFDGFSFSYKQNLGALRVFLCSHFSNNAIVCTWPNPTDGNWHKYELTYDGSTSAEGMGLTIDGLTQPRTVVLDNLTTTSINYSDNGGMLIGGGKIAATGIMGSMDNIKATGGISFDIPVRTGSGSQIVNDTGPDGVLSGEYSWSQR